MAKYKIIGELDYVQGHLRYGHLELKIDKEVWDRMPEEEQKEYLLECGKLKIDDYSVNDRGDITEITKEEI